MVFLHNYDDMLNRVGSLVHRRACQARSRSGYHRARYCHENYSRFSPPQNRASRQIFFRGIF